MAPSTMHSPGSLFLLMEEWLEMEGTCMSRYPRQVHGDNRRALSGLLLLWLGSPTGVSPQVQVGH